MRHVWIMSVVVLLTFALAGCGSEQKQDRAEQKTQKTQMAKMDEGYQGHEQTTCPVMGGKINKEIYMDYEGKRIYFCCPGCEKTFMENPEKYMQKMMDEGVVLEDAPQMGD